MDAPRKTITIETFVESLPLAVALKLLTALNAKVGRQKPKTFCLHAPDVACINCIEP